MGRIKKIIAKLGRKERPTPTKKRVVVHPDVWKDLDGFPPEVREEFVKMLKAFQKVTEEAPPGCTEEEFARRIEKETGGQVSRIDPEDEDVEVLETIASRKKTT